MNPDIINDRTYRNSDTTDPAFFLGQEVEHTPMQGQRTLFVVGVQKTEFIRATAMAHKCQHIYFGANQSFDASDLVAWTSMVQELLCNHHNENGAKYFCTLDFDVQHVDQILNTGLCEYNNFIPMISVKIPYADQLGYNATVKIDDTGFDYSNPGVWCHDLRGLMTRRKFTGWHEYSNDEVVE
jgi:hypothetical protein